MAGGVRSRRRSVGKAFGAIWPPGIMGTRGLAAAAGAGAAPSTTATSSLPTLPRLKPDRALSCFLRRGTRPAGNSTDSGRRLSVGFPAHLLEHFPDRRAAPGRRQGIRREQGDARRGGTRCDTYSTVTVGGGADVPDIPEVAGEQSGTAMPRQLPGTLLSESRRRMSWRTTLASPTRSDAWLAGSDGGHGTSAFRRSDMMAVR